MSGYNLHDLHFSQTDVVHKFGYNPAVALNTETDIWDFSSVSSYTYSTIADIDSITSDDDGDDQDIEIQGLDTNWNLVKQTITLTGQTRAPFTTSLLRIFRMKNVDSTTLAGTVYAYVNSAIALGVPDDDTKVRAVIQPGNNQTLMALYTIPLNFTGYMTSWWAGTINKTTNVSEIRMYRRESGGVFQIKEIQVVSTLGMTSFYRNYDIPVRIPEKTDIVITGNPSSNNTPLSAGFDIALRENA